MKGLKIVLGKTVQLKKKVLGRSEHSLNREMGTTGDPRVADKLRIYRLVEQQFEEIESQVRQEVVQNVRAKAEARNKALTTSKVKKDLIKPQTVTSKLKSGPHYICIFVVNCMLSCLTYL